jgi:hypothetical protein
VIKVRSAKAKGTKLEKFVADQLSKVGWFARRQPGSGIYQDFPHDVEARGPCDQNYIIECKSWKDGWRTGDNAMGAADLLVIKRDRGDPRVYMSWDTFERLAGTQQALKEQVEELETRLEAAGQVC